VTGRVAAATRPVRPASRRHDPPDRTGAGAGGRPRSTAAVHRPRRRVLLGSAVRAISRRRLRSTLSRGGGGTGMSAFPTGASTWQHKLTPHGWAWVTRRYGVSGPNSVRSPARSRHRRTLWAWRLRPPARAGGPVPPGPILPTSGSCGPGGLPARPAVRRASTIRMSSMGSAPSLRVTWSCTMRNSPGDRVHWISRIRSSHNTSATPGARNATPPSIRFRAATRSTPRARARSRPSPSNAPRVRPDPPAA
jgi:hypothetical protein